VSTQPVLPCSDEELVAACDAVNEARARMEAATDVFRRAVARRTAALQSRGVLPGDPK